MDDGCFVLDGHRSIVMCRDMILGIVDFKICRTLRSYIISSCCPQIWLNETSAPRSRSVRAPRPAKRRECTN